MICIYCFHGKTTITNSRGNKKGASTWRRHACPNCGKVFTSIETPVMGDSYRIANESDGSDTTYSRARLSASLLKSFGHLSGHELFKTIDSLLDTVERDLIASAYMGTLSKDELGMVVYEILKNFDPVASVQYAAQNGLVSAVSKRKRGRPSVR